MNAPAITRTDDEWFDHQRLANDAEAERAREQADAADAEWDYRSTFDD